MIDETLLKNEERAAIELRSLYRRYGYLPYKMSKFEEYELYIRNKDFLVSDRIITFNDTSGRLLALKPDVTLSIIKNGEDLPGTKQKVSYNENVYRVSERTHQYKEIMQAGLECIGDIDLYDKYEVISLAADSLAHISGDFVLQISHLGLSGAILGMISSDPVFTKKALALLSQKNSHDLLRLASEYGADEAALSAVSTLIGAAGKREYVLESLAGVCPDTAAPALAELRELSELLKASPNSDKIELDFSVINDMSYYNGFVFKGFLPGVCGGILSGGQYDRLMRKMGRRACAIGFALYLDMLSELEAPRGGYDADILLLYGDATAKADVAAAVNDFVGRGLTVRAERRVPPRLKYKTLVKLDGCTDEPQNGEGASVNA